MTEAGTVLRMRAVSKSFDTVHGPVHVLRGINIDIRDHDFVALTGPSGSGKSTFLNLAGLLDTPTSGGVWFCGRDTSRLDEAELSSVRKTAVGIVFQNCCVLRHRSALDNVAFRFRYMDIKAGEARRRARAALDLLGLSRIADQPARLLSGGELQRVAIARAVVLRPSLLLADEPTGNLDGQAAEVVMDTFARLNESGISILLATHNLGLLNYTSRHCICRGGQILDADT